jgi:hypothetical protein
VPASISMLVFMAMPSSIRGYARGVVKYIADSTSRRKRVCPGDERDRSPGRRWPAAAHTVADRDLGTRDPPTAISLSGQWAFRCGLARTSVASTSILVLVTNRGFPPFSATQPSHWGWLFLPHTCRSPYPSGSAQLGETGHSGFARNVMPRLERSLSWPEVATPDTPRISAVPLAARRAEEYPLS